MDNVGRHWRQDQPGLLIHNECTCQLNFRNLQVERNQPQGHYPDVSKKKIRSSEGFQANEGR